MPSELLCSDCGSPITSLTNVRTVARGEVVEADAA